MPLVAPAEFRALPADRQAAIITEMKQTLQLAYDHAVPIVIALPPKHPDPDLRSASGFFVQIDEQTYLGTADHVWRWYLDRREAGDGVMFQAGRFAISHDRSGILRDAKRDIVLIPVSEQEVRRSGHLVASTASGWPPPMPRVDSYVVFSGCPERLRERDSQDHIGFGSFSSIMRVTSATADNVICQFERESWVSDAVLPPPAPGDDMSGASGGPVFSLDHLLHVPLVGLIYEFNPGLFGSEIELLYMRPLAVAQFT
jgi:hypothetical protein